MKRRRIMRHGDLRLAAAVLATVAFAVLLNQPSRSANEPTWLDSTVLRLNLPADAPTLDAFREPVLTDGVFGIGQSSVTAQGSSESNVLTVALGN